MSNDAVPASTRPHALELKVPPPVIGLLCALAAWGLAHRAPGLALHWPGLRLLALAVMALGLALDLSALIAFRRARTTVNPMAPQQSVNIVRAGPYRFTRNPMYVGMACLLLALCLYLRNPLALLAPLAFVAYITRFQIIPEERILQARFGEPYARYLRAVRRWL